MTFIPRRRLGLLIGGLFLLALLAGIGLSIARLASASISLAIVVWVLVPLLGFPLALWIAYRLYGLSTACYRIDRDAFVLNWGQAFEQIPLADLAQPLPAAGLSTGLGRPPGLWWPGCLVGKRQVQGLGAVEFFATTGQDGCVLLRAGQRLLAISPPDVAAFLQAFTDSVRLGSLTQVPPRSQRPDFLFGRVWQQQPARFLLLAGLALPLLLLAFLVIRAPGLPEQGVPFGFLPSGQTGPLAPAGRLLLLPLIAGLSWLADLFAGVWVFRRETDRPLAYGLWAVAVLTGALLWGAALFFLEAA